ncbi:hydroxymethylglutaryl-lyase [Grosmannia clavigera kw1407]|uniref:hydroxymethylglutaryl-CoA lyase n=1 Tax=Grosmannia clavigera (strain kw1407 / UAMH 11150) TaxID=655863 RepID=F0X6X2_GROCL|nr:hydroxymethylglutaryl-lyase [Grosmannia clavigera kw1407]EFX06412.1 hydroxymethylglutaryl-lyase [Grosmannia clavigera kw1407]
MKLPTRPITRLSKRCCARLPAACRYATTQTTAAGSAPGSSGPSPSSNRIKIVEVGPRDGLQNEKKSIPLATKIELIERLAKTGVSTIEAGSFVAPKWVPQMSNSAEILEHVLAHRVASREPISYAFLVPNSRGLADATAILQQHAGAFVASLPTAGNAGGGPETTLSPLPAVELAVFAAATETFSRKNLNCDVATSLERFRDVIRTAKETQAAADGAPLRVRAYISVVLGCPFEGYDVDPRRVAELATDLLEMGADEIALGDTTGMGTAPRTKELLRCVTAAGIRHEDVALHLHDTYGQALVNTAVALEHGIRTFDSAVGGLGGCPYSPGATGNVATENLVYFLESLGMDTGVDLDAMADIGQWITAEIGKANDSSVAVICLPCTHKALAHVPTTMPAIRLGTCSPATADTPAETLAILEDFTKRAAAEKVDILLFPEAFLGSGYPRGEDFGCAIGSRTPAGREAFLQYFRRAVDLGDVVGDAGAGGGRDWVERRGRFADEAASSAAGTAGDGTRETLERVARETGVFIVSGAIERAGGSLYCSVVYVCPKRGMVGKRRKVQPTGSERLIWAAAGPATLRAVSTVIRGVRINMAAAICWENYMPLLRQSLYAQNINLYLAPTADGRDAWLGLLRTIGTEGRCFVVSSNMCTTAESTESLAADGTATTTAEAAVPAEARLSRLTTRGGSAVVSPFGDVIAGPQWDDARGIVFADVDFDDCIRGRLDIDMGGSYSRNDSFKLSVEGLDLSPLPHGIDDRTARGRYRVVVVLGEEAAVGGGATAAATAAAARHHSTASLAAVLAAVEADDSGVHVIRSTGTSPHANLAVEQRLLERSRAASRVLFQYHNGPCVVMGRNQNPWAEVAVRRLRARDVALVRRRSGGGAVYHDGGNANWSVLGPSAGFDRDRHVVMVARALQRLGVSSARVNERHDIVVGGVEEDKDSPDRETAYKISGSAYKLTRHRALHHGTCLLGTDLTAVSGLLRSPAAAYVLARGVASVRSPVRNIDIATRDGIAPAARFAAAVTREFEALYGRAASHSIVDVDCEAAAGFAFDPVLARGYAELMTPEWIYGQTPQFSFSTHPSDEDPRDRPPPPPTVPPSFRLAFTARHGRLHDVVLSGLPYLSPGDDLTTAAADRSLAAALDGRPLYEIYNWQHVLAQASIQPLDAVAVAATGAWLDGLLGVATGGTAATA